MPSRILCCSNNRAAVADAYSPISQLKKSLNREFVQKSNTVTSETTTDTTRTSLDKEQVQPNESIFRTPSLISEDSDDDLLCLKRANPVYESDDEEAELFRMPIKRQRKNTTDNDTRELTLHWDDRIVEDEGEGYQIILASLE